MAWKGSTEATLDWCKNTAWEDGRGAKFEGVEAWASAPKLPVKYYRSASPGYIYPYKLSLNNMHLCKLHSRA